MDFKFPDVGEGLTEGVLVKWLVAVGDSISKDQPIAQVETDKAVVDIPCPDAGVVSELLAKEGETMTVGDVILKLNTDGTSSKQETTPEPTEHKPIAESAPAQSPPSKQPTQQSCDKKSTQACRAAKTSSRILAVPKVRHYAKEHHIDLTQVSASGSQGQITMGDIEGQAANQPVKHEEQTHATVQIKVPEPHTTTQANTSVQDAPQSVARPKRSLNILATPSTRRLARELGVDITTVKGSGRNGKITDEDVQKAKGAPQQAETTKDQYTAVVPKPSPAPSPETAKKVSISTTEQDETNSNRVPLSNIRKVIAKRMVESQQHTASVTTTDEIDVTDIYGLYENEREKLSEEVRLSFLSFITKATTLVLQKYPVFNAVLDEEKQEMIMHDKCHIGIAAATPKGLLVPVIENAHIKSIKQLAGEIIEVATQAREGTLSPSRMQGSTFTISNIGSIGGQIFTPIINYPEVAILGVGRVLDKPAVINGEIVPRKLMWLSLTFDHRVVDGADAAFFVKALKEYLEDPDKLFMEMT